MTHARRTIVVVLVVFGAAACSSAARKSVTVRAPADSTTIAESTTATDSATTTPDSVLPQPDGNYNDFADYLANSVLARGTEVADVQALQAQLKFPLPLPTDATDLADARVVAGPNNGGILVVDAAQPLNQYAISGSDPWLGTDGVTEDQWKTNLDNFVATYGKETAARGGSVEVVTLPSTQQVALIGVEPLEHKVVVTFLHPAKAVVLMEFNETVSPTDALAAANAYAQQLSKATG